MNKRSVFSKFSLDRSEIQWENYIGLLTPWENLQGVFFKREDYFAPLGYGGPNGAKLRQLIWYINRYRENKTHILTGASVQSPQLSMSAIVGKHYGLSSRQVVYSKPNSILKHENPKIAYGFEAEFEYASGPYNPILQRKVEDLKTDESLVVEYGITMSQEIYSEEEVRKFHEVGAHQTLNMPAITKLIIPAGSCNSLTSILLGLSKDSYNLDEILTVGIGPDKRDWLKRRLEYIGVDTSKFTFDWKHYSLHDSGYSSYTDKFEGESFNGIDFHPTYEAKIWRWLRENSLIENNDSTGFWIVGSAPSTKVIEPFYTRK